MICLYDAGDKKGNINYKEITIFKFKHLKYGGQVKKHNKFAENMQLKNEQKEDSDKDEEENQERYNVDQMIF